ncbi:acetyltransferase [Longilinea arvoryzae]|uniref:Acetyltransferase n=1 Tax=Longilinea arvoryzae TaxID=360412 RepID=A0A0S7BIN3_9CHLR|nr:GNAT family N-acetyltransferase [Longilinea arvoryzae]GAP14326.1 acetyltransferase [Longilinea arvoryzae]
MFTLLTPDRYPSAAPIFQPLDLHLTIASILAGYTPGQIAVDDPQAPTAAAAWFGHKLFLAGNSRNVDFIQQLSAYFDQVLFPQARQRGQEVFIAFLADAAWKTQFSTLFGSNFARQVDAPRQVHTFRSGANRFDTAWREKIPAGLHLSPVDAQLLAQTHLKHMDYLTDETQSERSSVQDFLDHSFGVCLHTDESLIAWCLSEYNAGARCEVGIATVDEYQRRGLGTLVGSAFIEEALKRGIAEIGWHCWARNEASAALARRLGYALMLDYPVTVCCFED